MSQVDSSIISEEIRDEVDMTQSMIPDEVGTTSAKPGMVSYQSIATKSGLSKGKRSATNR